VTVFPPSHPPTARTHFAAAGDNVPDDDAAAARRGDGAPALAADHGLDVGRMAHLEHRAHRRAIVTAASADAPVPQPRVAVVAARHHNIGAQGCNKAWKK
jgi:hypothetical protein